MFKDSLILIKQRISDRKVATIAPTSPFSIKTIFSFIDFSKDNIIVEYGPGTGVITRKLLERMTNRSRLVVIERNHALFTMLGNTIRDPRLTVVQGDVLDIGNIMRKLNIDNVDCVISGIPFTLFTHSQIISTVSQTHRVLKGGGTFILYQFSLFMLKHLGEKFKVVRKKILPFNIPPLFLMVAKKY